MYYVQYSSPRARGGVSVKPQVARFRSRDRNHPARAREGARLRPKIFPGKILSGPRARGRELIKIYRSVRPSTRNDLNLGQICPRLIAMMLDRCATGAQLRAAAGVAETLEMSHRINVADRTYHLYEISKAPREGARICKKTDCRSCISGPRARGREGSLRLSHLRQSVRPARARARGWLQERRSAEMHPPRAPAREMYCLLILASSSASVYSVDTPASRARGRAFKERKSAESEPPDPHMAFDVWSYGKYDGDNSRTVFDPFAGAGTTLHGYADAYPAATADRLPAAPESPQAPRYADAYPPGPGGFLAPARVQVRDCPAG